ncbi:MAG: zinc ribbon domain-containing protein [Pirellulales bacterium]
MPLYEYACQNCSSHFEVLVRGQETPTCPQCGCQKLEKEFSVPAAHVKDGGGSLPVCQPSPPAGGCGAPWCGTGSCGR